MGRVMIDSNEPPAPRQRSGRWFWIAGLTLGVITGAIVALELAMAGGPVGR